MLTLLKFLLARITETEAIATAAVWASDDPEWDGVDTWDAIVMRDRRTATNDDFAVACVVGPFKKELQMNGSDPVRVPAVAEHIALNDPARVLAECAAKRAILDATMNLESFDYPDDGAAYSHVAHKQNAILWALARVYADHPDFQEEWRQ